MQALLLVSVGDQIRINGEWLTVRSITSPGLTNQPLIQLAGGGKALRLEIEDGIVLERSSDLDATKAKVWDHILSLVDVTADVAPPDVQTPRQALA